MKTAVEKLMILALLLGAGVMLFMPMRSGREEVLTLNIERCDMEIGQSFRLEYALDSAQAQTVTYTSDHPNIAAVDQGGLVTAVSPGSAVIRVQANGGAFDVAQINVSGVAVTELVMNTETLEMEKGEVSGLSVRTNANATQPEVSWRSLNENIARVDAQGQVTAVGAGSTSVIASSASGLFASAQVKVNVRAMAVQITPENLTVGVGTVLPLRVRFLPEDATDTAAQWAANAPDVVSMRPDGTLTAVGTGSATVTVTTAQGLTASTQVRVEPATRDFRVNMTELTLERGERYPLTAEFIDSEGKVDRSVDHHVEWASSDPSVAEVQDGMIIARASGRAVVGARADGFLAECVVRVRTTVSEILLDETQIYLLRDGTDQTIQLNPKVVPEDADDTRIRYASDNELVATVSQDGVVTLTGGYGTALISLTTSGGARAEYAVHVVMELPQEVAEE
ncbi:MAG: Ig-like domain-containing protein [Clostridia bacterium]|nr:Ig-like domain-containing protein [Clostridia bacterium]